MNRTTSEPKTQRVLAAPAKIGVMPQLIRFQLQQSLEDINCGRVLMHAVSVPEIQVIDFATERGAERTESTLN